MRTPIGTARGEGNCVRAIVDRTEAGVSATRLARLVRRKVLRRADGSNWRPGFARIALLHKVAELLPRTAEWRPEMVATCHQNEWQ